MPQNFVPFLKENARTEMIAVLNERLADTGFSGSSPNNVPLGAEGSESKMTVGIE